MSRSDRSRTRPSFRQALAFAFLAAQLASIAYARVTPARYFAWAPYDVLNVFSLEVRVDGRILANNQVGRRYRIYNLTRDNRSIQHVIDAVRQYEETYGSGDEAEVLLRYTRNGGGEQIWQWPYP